MLRDATRCPAFRRCQKVLSLKKGHLQRRAAPSEEDADYRALPLGRFPLGRRAATKVRKSYTFEEQLELLHVALGFALG